jgi:hypothetical protein
LDDKSFAQLVSMARIHCTAEECSSVLGVSPDTLDRRLKERGYTGWDDFYVKHTAEGRAALRRMQWKSAEQGNVGSQIWLGKQLLGQRDFSRQELSGPNGGPIEHKDVVERDAEEFTSRVIRLALAVAQDSGTSEADA